MLNHDITPPLLKTFYNLPTLEPSRIEDLKLTYHNTDISDIDNLTPEERFDMLSKLVNGPIKKPTHYTKRDLEDPLRGAGSNVAEDLIRKRVISGPKDPELENYVISSQKFNTRQFLTTVHRDTPIEDLTSSLKFLNRTIASQESELRSVIDANFIGFVNCKKAIDGLLVEFRNAKSVGQTERQNSKVFNPQRHALVNKHGTLSSELEEAISNLNTTSTLMIRPIMDNKTREGKLNTLMEFVRSQSFFFDLPRVLDGYLRDRNRPGNQDKFIDEYNRFLEEKQEFLQHHKRKYEERIKAGGQQAEEAEQEYALTCTALARVFEEVERMANVYREIAFQELLSLDHVATKTPQTVRSGKSAAGVTSAKFMGLVEKLYQMQAVDRNPIHDFLANQLNGAVVGLDEQIAKFDSKFGAMQERLVDYVSSLPSARENGSHVRYIGDKFRSVEDYFVAAQATPTAAERRRVVSEVFDSGGSLDLSLVNEAWMVLANFVRYLDEMLASSMSRFTQNYQHYYRYDVDTDGALKDTFFSLVEKVSHVLVVLFEDENGDNNQLDTTPANYRQFLPHYTNSLAAVYYLSSVNKRLNSFLTTMGSLVAAVGNVSQGADTNKMVKHLRSTSTKVSQKILEAVCAVWVNDCAQLYDLEEWTVRPSAEPDAAYTELIEMVSLYQEYMLDKLHELVNSDVDGGDLRIVSAHASKRVLVSVEIQFMRSLNIIVDSVMKRYTIEREKKSDSDGIPVYKVLAMNNFDQLSRHTYPSLIRIFDRLFNKNLAAQKLKLFADIDKASLTIYEDILDKEKRWVADRVHNHFVSGTHATVIRVDAFVYEVLIHLVKLVHTVKPLTGADIFASIVDELQQCFLKAVVDNVRAVSLSRVEQQNVGVDVRFFCAVFEHSSLPLSQNAVRLAEKVEGGEGEEVLMENLRDSKNQFDCF